MALKGETLLSQAVSKGDEFLSGDFLNGVRKALKISKLETTFNK